MRSEGASHVVCTIVKRIALALRTIEDGYIKHSLLAKDGSLRSRVYRKLYNALAYFRRSFHASADRGAAIVNLSLALRGIKGQRMFTAEVRQLAGSSDSFLDSTQRHCTATPATLEKPAQTCSVKIP
jgi:hypothetical protein